MQSAYKYLAKQADTQLQGTPLFKPLIIEYYLKKTKTGDKKNVSGITMGIT
jgi:hypothetical protein